MQVRNSGRAAGVRLLQRARHGQDAGRPTCGACKRRGAGEPGCCGRERGGRAWAWRRGRSGRGCRQGDERCEHGQARPGIESRNFGSSSSLRLVLLTAVCVCARAYTHARAYIWTARCVHARVCGVDECLHACVVLRACPQARAIASKLSCTLVTHRAWQRAANLPLGASQHLLER